MSAVSYSSWRATPCFSSCANPLLAQHSELLAVLRARMRCEQIGIVELDQQLAFPDARALGEVDRHDLAVRLGLQLDAFFGEQRAGGRDVSANGTVSTTMADTRNGARSRGARGCGLLPICTLTLASARLLRFARVQHRHDLGRGDCTHDDKHGQGPQGVLDERLQGSHPVPSNGGKRHGDPLGPENCKTITCALDVPHRVTFRFPWSMFRSWI